VPAKTKIMRVIAEVTQTFSGGDVVSCDAIVGMSSNTDTILKYMDLKTAVGVYGDDLAEEGTYLSAGLGYIPSWTTAREIYVRYSTTSGPMSHLTQGSITYWIECVTYP